MPSPSQTQYGLFDTVPLATRQQEFAESVAHGQQSRAEERFKNLNYDQKQDFMCTPMRFTDYSGRTFHCSPFSYLCWAMDVDFIECFLGRASEATKRKFLRMMNDISSQGLTYTQNGAQVTGSKCWEPRPILLEARSVLDPRYIEKTQEEWQRVLHQTGAAQREVPAHVAQQYCRESLGPIKTRHPLTPNQRTLACYDFTQGINSSKVSWFPLSDEAGKRLGEDFAVSHNPAFKTDISGLGAYPGAFACSHPLVLGDVMLVNGGFDMSAFLLKTKQDILQIHCSLRETYQSTLSEASARPS